MSLLTLLKIRVECRGDEADEGAARVGDARTVEGDDADNGESLSGYEFDQAKFNDFERAGGDNGGFVTFEELEGYLTSLAQQ